MPNVDITDEQFEAILERHLAPLRSAIRRHQEEADAARAAPRPRPQTTRSTAPTDSTVPSAEPMLKPASRTRLEEDSGRTVWHPGATGEDRYRNIPTTDDELEVYGLYYDRYGTLRERRGGMDGSQEWGAEVFRCSFGPGACGRLWTDPREAHCMQCHRHFGSDTALERHAGETCRYPGKIQSLVVSRRKYGLTWVRADHPDSR